MNLINQFDRWLKTVFFIPMVIFLILINVWVIKWDPSIKNPPSNNSIIDSLIQEKAKVLKNLDEVCNVKNMEPDIQSSINPLPSYIAEFKSKNIETHEIKAVTKSQTKAQYAS